MSYNYIRVAAMISDPYTRVSKIHSVAFKSNDGGTSGPFGSMGNMTATNKADFIQFVKDAPTLGGAHIDDGPHKEMFVPDTNARATTVNFPTKMIAFHDFVYGLSNHRNNLSLVENTTQQYYVYIYARNDTGYEFIQPSDVVLVV